VKCGVKRVVLVLCFALLAAPSVSRAVAEEQQAGVEVPEHGEHGPLTLKEIVSGKEAMSFWGSVVNFALLIYLIRVMSKKPLASFLTGRREAIERGLKEASEAKRNAERVYEEYNQRMATLDATLAKLKSDVSAAAEQDRNRIVQEAEQGVARLRAETAALITRQGEQLEAQIRREVVAAATTAAERAVRESATPEDQQRLADAFSRELAAVAAKQPRERA
jgi:F-type H+-transporting ATPase subunit b